MDITGVHLRDRRSGAGREHERQAVVETEAPMSRRREGPRHVPVWHEWISGLVDGPEGEESSHMHTANTLSVCCADLRARVRPRRTPGRCSLPRRRRVRDVPAGCQEPARNWRRSQERVVRGVPGRLTMASSSFECLLTLFVRT